MSDSYATRSQIIQNIPRTYRKYVPNVFNNLSGGKSASTSQSPAATLSRGYSKYTTEHLEYPIGVSNDKGLDTGNHGHYMMFYINEQSKATLRTSKQGEGRSAVEDEERMIKEYGIPDFIKDYNDLKGKYTDNGLDTTITQQNETIKQWNIDNAVAIESGLLNERKLIPQETRTGKFKSTLFLDRAPTRRLKTGIAMYMPGTAKVSYKSQYDKTPIGALTGQAINAYNNLVGGRGREGLANIMKMDVGVQEMLRGAFVKGVGIIPGLEGLEEAYEMSQGEIISDRVEFAFKGIDHRTFDYTFKMIPKSEEEAEAIRKIVFAFKSNMLPEFAGGNRSGRRMVVPNTFDIQYMYAEGPNHFLHHISTCVCTGVDVTYGSGEKFKTYNPIRDQGTPPVETSMTLNFQEMELITREKVFEGF